MSARGAVMFGLALAMAGAETGHAQSYSRGGDPCQSSGSSGYGAGGYGGGGYGAGGYGTSGAIGALVGLIGQTRRDQACTDERKAQWAEYTAKQKAAKDAADAEAGRQREARETADRQQQQAAEARADQTARATRAEAIASARAEKQRAVRQAQSHRDAQLAAEQRRQRHVALARAEASPDNQCRTPAMARGVLAEWNGLDNMKAAGVKAIDIEHVSTVAFDGPGGMASCHGVFVTNQGFKIAGTATVKKNVAGDPMFVWKRDADQDLSAYDAPPVTALSPEMAGDESVAPRALSARPVAAVSPAVDH